MEMLDAVNRALFRGKAQGSIVKAGLMESVPHRRLIRGVIVLKDQDVERVTAFLREWNATHHKRKVALEAADQRAFKASN